jgi:hypothetical protein
MRASFSMPMMTRSAKSFRTRSRSEHEVAPSTKALRADPRSVP